MKTEEICPCSGDSAQPPVLEETAGGCHIKMAERQLFEHSLALLIFTIALAISCIFGLKTIILGNVAVFYRYWHCLPCLLFAIGTWVMPELPQAPATRALRCAALALLAFSPFPTWALLGSGNTYLELCAFLCLLASIACLLTYSRYIRSLAQRAAQLRLQQQARKTQWLLLYVVLVPLCALYLAELAALAARNGGAWRSIFNIWGYGQISMYLRILLYWGLLQSTTLSLLTFLLISRQLRSRLPDKTPERA